MDNEFDVKNPFQAKKKRKMQELHGKSVAKLIESISHSDLSHLNR